MTPPWLRVTDGVALNGEALAAALRGPIDHEGLLSRANFADDRYVRVPLYRDDRLEARLLCWRPGQASALHGHGRSACAFRVLAGVATEDTLNGPSRRLPPDALAVARPDEVHQVSNRESTPLITLHLYAPPLPVDQPSAAAGRSIVIVGGGFCGTAMAIHLLRRQDPNLRVTLVETAAQLGQGVAYGTWDPAHLLNVPAGRMSLDPTDPEDFTRFAQERLPGTTPGTLLPRRLYAAYLLERLAEAIQRSPARLRVVRDRAVRLTRNDEGWRVHLASSAEISTQTAVLATGVGPPTLPDVLQPLRNDPRLILDPYAPGALSSLKEQDRVLLVGTGLTAMDVLLTLRHQGRRAPVHAVSRHGRWPRAHREALFLQRADWLPSIDDAPKDAAALAAWVRDQVRTAARQGIPWQAVIGALRPHTPRLWGQLSWEERQKLLDRFGNEWEVARHRAPGPAAAMVRDGHRDGWLRTRRGGLSAAVAAPDGVRVTFRDDGWTQDFDVIVVCAGRQPAAPSDPLWRHLFLDRLALPDPLGLGLLTDDNGAITHPEGVHPDLFALGALYRPTRFESTSVPELSAAVASLAARLAPSTTAMRPSLPNVALRLP